MTSSPMSLLASLENTAQNYPTSFFFDFLGQKTSYREGVAQIASLATGLRYLGIKPEQRVGLFLTNTPYYGVAYFALLKIGAVPVPLDPHSTEDALAHLLVTHHVETAFTLDQRRIYAPIIGMTAETPLRRLILCPIAQALPWGKRFFFTLLRRGELLRWERDATHIAWGDLLLAPDDTRLADEALRSVCLPTTSALSVHADHEPTRSFSLAREGKERILCALSLAHPAMMDILHEGIAAAAGLVLIPKATPVAIISAIKQTKPTFFPVTQEMLAALTSHPHIREKDLKAITLCLIEPTETQPDSF